MVKKRNWGFATHCIVQHRAGIPGIEAMTMLTDHSFPRHSHDQFGIGVMTAGAQRSWSGIGQVESGAGDVIMLNPGEIHDGTPLGGTRGWHILYVDPELVARELGDEADSRELVIRPVARDEHLAAHLLQLFAQLQSPARDSSVLEESFLCCLMRVTQRHGLGGPRRQPSSPSILKAIQRLEAAPEAPASLAELAALSGISRFQLLRGFFREVGATPHVYLMQLRVRLVRRHLAAGKSPADAALLAGFSDQPHMTRAFVRQYGITPARYQAAIS